MHRWNDVRMSVNASTSRAASAPCGRPRVGAVRFSKLTIAAGFMALMLAAAAAARAQAVTSSPDSVQSALGVLSQVVTDSGKAIADHRYDLLPRESSEFEAGLTALEKQLGSRPSTLKTSLEPLIGKARIASSAMREAVEAHRDSMLSLTHRQLADAVSQIIASFPPELRPASSG